ncbi:MAG: jacalin-like lectin [Arenicella sp.]
MTGYTNDSDGESEAISAKHGGDGGSCNPNVLLDVKFPTTYVKSISVTTNNNQNNYVDYVPVTTNAAQNNTQAWGAACANETMWTKENSTFFIGWLAEVGSTWIT